MMSVKNFGCSLAMVHVVTAIRINGDGPNFYPTKPHVRESNFMCLEKQQAQIDNLVAIKKLPEFTEALAEYFDDCQNELYNQAGEATYRLKNCKEQAITMERLRDLVDDLTDVDEASIALKKVRVTIENEVDEEKSFRALWSLILGQVVPAFESLVERENDFPRPPTSSATSFIQIKGSRTRASRDKFKSLRHQQFLINQVVKIKKLPEFTQTLAEYFEDCQHELKGDQADTMEDLRDLVGDLTFRGDDVDVNQASRALKKMRVTVENEADEVENFTELWQMILNQVVPVFEDLVERQTPPASSATSFLQINKTDSLEICRKYHEDIVTDLQNEIDMLTHEAGDNTGRIARLEADITYHLRMVEKLNGITLVSVNNI